MWLINTQIHTWNVRPSTLASLLVSSHCSDLVSAAILVRLCGYSSPVVFRRQNLIADFLLLGLSQSSHSPFQTFSGPLAAGTVLAVELSVGAVKVVNLLLGFCYLFGFEIVF